MNDYIIHCPEDPNFKPDSKGLGVVLLETMRKHGEMIAHIEAETGETQTYNQLILRSIRVAQQLQAKGIKPNDVITLCSLNIMDSYVAFLATVFIGSIISSLDPCLSSDDVTHLLKKVKPKLLFCGTESVELIETALINTDQTIQMVVFGETKKYVPFSDLLISTGTEDEFEARQVDDLFDTAIIFFSSGTTGLPKLICATHYGIMSKIRRPQQSNGPKYNHVYLNFTTLYGIATVGLLYMSIIHGATRLLVKKFEAELALQLIEKYKVSIMYNTPFIMHSFIQCSNAADYDTKSVKFVIIGGDMAEEEQLTSFRKLMPSALVMNSYGITEAHGGVIGFNPFTDIPLYKSKPRSVGRAMQGLSYKIVDLETEQTVGPNHPGEIRIKGKSITTGYYNQLEESAKLWDKDGFLHTGDIGYYDEDKCFYLIDRIKNTFRCQSTQIIPAELETIIRCHPDVKIAAVIGLPHEIDGDRPMAVVVLKPGASVTEADILNFVNEQVPDCKQLRAGVHFVDDLPYTPTGKLQRRLLCQKFLDKHFH